MPFPSVNSLLSAKHTPPVPFKYYRDMRKSGVNTEGIKYMYQTLRVLICVIHVNPLTSPNISGILLCVSQQKLNDSWRNKWQKGQTDALRVSAVLLEYHKDVNMTTSSHQHGPQMSLLSHKQSRLINGKWWHGCARLGTAGKERGCIGTGGAESLEGESGSKQRNRRGVGGG